MKAADPWPDAASASLRGLAVDLRRRRRGLVGKVDEDAVHDMRTATRRVRTAISLYDDVVVKRRKPIGDELRRVARRLGSVRDLDILLTSLDETAARGGPDADRDQGPLRRALRAERRRSAARLRRELGRHRFKRALDRLPNLARPKDRAPKRVGEDIGARVADRAPDLIWHAFGELLAFHIDPKSVAPETIHRMRIAAKKFRYTLEAFDGALGGAATLIQQVTALQDAAGEMHDSTVARDRASEFLAGARLKGREHREISAFAAAQADRVEAGRSIVARRLRVVRSPAFRDSLDREVVAMGRRASRSVAPAR